MNRRELAEVNAEIAEQDAPVAAPEPQPYQGITDPATIAEIRANHARATRIEFLPWWRRWPVQLADSLGLDLAAAS